MEQARFLLSFLGVLVYAITCEALESEPIVGGYKAVPADFSYFVGFESPLGKSYCGGAILDDYHVITAAHCFSNDFKEYSNNAPRRRVYAVAGVDKYNPHRNANNPLAVVRLVQKVYIHRYNKHTYKNDIAVVRLSEPLNLAFNRHLSRIQLPTDTRSTYANEPALFCGIGWTEAEDEGKGRSGSSSEGILMWSWAKVSHEPYALASQIHASLVNNKRYGGGVCSGDSGGPLVHDGKVLIGVLSFSQRGCSDYPYPATYTRVSEFLSFIKTTTHGRVFPGTFSHSYF